MVFRWPWWQNPALSCHLVDRAPHAGYRPHMNQPSSIDTMAQEKLIALQKADLHRRLYPTERRSGMAAKRDGAALLSFSDNDYLGLSTHPSIIRAATKAVEAYGASAGASRLVSGNHPLYDAFETRLAAFKSCEAALVFGSGYLANIGTIPVFAGPQDVIFIDELAHACLFAGAQLSRARVQCFAHNDMAHLGHLLARHRHAHRHALILTDGVFSMDGDQAPLKNIHNLAKTHDAWLMVDDAHGLGVLGNGHGTAFSQGVQPDLMMGTLSKALGSYGGYVAGSHAVVDLLRNRARSLVYTTGLPPSALAAAHASLEIISMDPERCARPLSLARRFCQTLGLPAPQSAVVPLIIGSPQKAMDAQEKLQQAGFLVVAIRPPTVPENTARLRFSFSATHQEKDVDRLCQSIKNLGLAP
ncbi:putative 8-amino-7-oxononanoate synthase [Iodidimonas gelatinilytica]|uniref:8-amino-7-ketopelargonate synthase n=2 Tax=Iodidimonas gelatinilytica TaxID=1236966 RepID=A0A5A7N2J7_9PROT|nr:putative 8-amino-7-oxononanoate synthase [Iodidimonas gelatinilytica]GER01924.1 putative 8-amino-7-oxononanoate synthase [Iodidimonas gelatinilytica]